jgi:hypothetical protein
MFTTPFYFFVKQNKKTHPQDIYLGGESYRGATPVHLHIAAEA